MEAIIQNIQSGRYSLIAKRKGRSPLWEIFAEILKDDQTILQGWLCCRDCRKIFKYNGKQSSNLNRHKCFLARKSDGPKKILSEDANQETIDVLSNWVIEDCRPFSTVSGNGFKKMAQYFISLGARHGENIDLTSLIPHPTTLSRRIATKAEKKKEEIKEIVQTMVKSNKAAMTIHMWSDNYIKRNFLCATFHYEKNLQMQEIVLGVKSLDHMKSNGENIRTKLTTLMKDFGTTDFSKIKFVTDRGSNVKKALSTDIRINCSNHLLSNLMDAAFDSNIELKQIVNSCKKRVKLLQQGENGTSSPRTDLENIFESSPRTSTHSTTIADFQLFFPHLLTEPCLPLLERAKQEFEQYRTEIFKLDSEFEIFKWWDQNKNKYPLLNQLHFIDTR